MHPNRNQIVFYLKNIPMTNTVMQMPIKPNDIAPMAHQESA
jgi:hypothetical protein